MIKSYVFWDCSATEVPQFNLHSVSFFSHQFVCICIVLCCFTNQSDIQPVIKLLNQLSFQWIIYQLKMDHLPVNCGYHCCNITVILAPSYKYFELLFCLFTREPIQPHTTDASVVPETQGTWPLVSSCRKQLPKVPQNFNVQKWHQTVLFLC